MTQSDAPTTIHKGPSLTEMFISLLNRPQITSVSFGIGQEKPTITAQCIINGMEREDGSGNNWNIFGWRRMMANANLPVSLYYDVNQQLGTFGSQLQWSLPKMNKVYTIGSGPSDLEMAFSLLMGTTLPNKRNLVTFQIGGTANSSIRARFFMKVFVDGLYRDGQSIHDWQFHGYQELQDDRLKRVVGHYNTHTRQGEIGYPE